jgi:hypothetical protein
MAQDTVVHFQKLLATNTTNTFSSESFIPTITAPVAGVGEVINTKFQYPPGGPNITPSILDIILYGQGTGGTSTVGCRVWGWTNVLLAGVPSAMYVPALLADFVGTLSTIPGLAAQPLVVADLLCDKLALANGFNSNVLLTCLRPLRR